MKGLRLVAASACSLPWLRSLPVFPGALGRLVDDAFFPLCHHLAGRVLVLAGVPMCVCSRCAGLYAGMVLGFVLGELGRAANPRRWVTGALALTLLDVATQDAGLHLPYHPARLATGALLGWAITAWMVAELEKSGRRRVRGA